jgi:iron(III) transport system permease protein
MVADLQARPSEDRRASKRVPIDRILRLIWVFAVAILIGYPIARVFGQSFVSESGGFTLGNYAVLGTESRLLEATLNSLWLGLGTTFLSLILALPLAWLVVRTDMPWRGFFRGSAVLTFAAPSFIAALGWILLLGPRGGMLNGWLMSGFGLESPPFNIFTPWGIIFVLSMFLYPLVFLPVAAALEGIDSSMEQAAAGLGSSRLRVLRTVTFPLVLPAVISGSILVFVTSIITFGPVALLGAPARFEALPTVLLSLMNAPPRIEIAAVVAVPVLVLVAALMVLQRKFLGADRQFTVIGGKPGGGGAVELGKLKPLAMLFSLGVFVISIVLPFGVLLATSMRGAIGLPLGGDNFVLTDNYRSVFSDPKVIDALTNSLLLALGGTAIAIAIAVIAAWLVHRTKARSNGVIAPMMAAPLAFPGAVLGIGIIIAYAGVPFALGGTLLILLIAYVGSALPFTYAYIHAGIGQIHSEVEQASRSLGASWWRTTNRITLPLLKPSLLAATMLNFVLLFRELDLSVFLYTGSNPTVATILYTMATEARYQTAGALSIVILVVNIGVVIVAMRLLSRGSHRS